MLIRGDARALPLVAGTVDCCVTSPPYWGLRRYPDPRQLGFERTPDAYVAAMIGVFREVWRVLKPQGTCWINLGDTYNSRLDGSHGGWNGSSQTQQRVMNSGYKGQTPTIDLPSKNLCGIPWRVAFALQADGWYLRSDIIWAKPNPMPESVTDRPTRSHEYVFLLTKSARYYYDAAAIAEPCSLAMQTEVEQGYDGLGLKDYEAAGVQNPSSVKARIIAGAKNRQTPPQDNQHRLVDNVAEARAGGAPHDAPFGLTRNKRSVWTIPTQPYSSWAQTSHRVRVSWDESDGDTTRITSANCPVHGDRAVQAAKALCGGHVSDLVNHSAHSDDDLAVLPFRDSVPTDRPLVGCFEDETRDSLAPSHAALATPRNNQSRKTVHALETSPPCTPSGRTRAGTDGRSELLDSADSVARTSESSTEADYVSNEPAKDGARIELRIGDKCSCEYYRTVTENISHFATFPEALVEPCILAGCPMGGLVLDPFVGTGTVLAVAARLGRRGVGVDLSYQDLATERTAQRGLAFGSSEA